MWNLEKWYRWYYLQARNMDTDMEISVWISKGKGVVEWVGGLGLTNAHYWYNVCINIK